MTAELVTPAALAGVDAGVVRRKMTRRIVPLVFVLYVIANIDRANVSFAKLQMQPILGFSDAVFGWGFGIFFAGYLLLEIPGALVVEHWSARKWFCRILVTWGLCSMGMALVRTPGQFYLARFLLGLAEAGFFPGIIVYFTHWFPRADRGRAMAGLVLATPSSIVVGSLVSSRLMTMDALGLDGWQWLFLVEGAPAVLMGVAVLFLLSDRPSQAKWLTAAERHWLEQTLRAERLEAAVGGITLLQALRRSTVWLLGLGILAANTGNFALVYWLPSTVKNLLQQETHAAVTDQEVLAWTGLIYACGLAGAFVSGQSSDRTGDRKWHCVMGQVMTAVFLTASVVVFPSWPAVLPCLCCVGFFAYFWPPPFWVLPTLSLSASTAAVTIGFINICANTAGLLGPPAGGEMKDAGLDDRALFLFAASCLAVGGVIVAMARLRTPAARVRGEQRNAVKGPFTS